MDDLKIMLNQILNEKEDKIIPENIKEGVKIFDVEGALESLNGEEKEIEPSITQQEIIPSEGKNAITRVIVNAVTSAIDANIKPENIKSGITILGVTGTYTGETIE